MLENVQGPTARNELLEGVVTKARILQAYDLVSEAYHQKFRNMVKQGGQIRVEFAREKQNAFDRWLSSTKVDDYDMYT